MGIRIRQKGNFKNTERFLRNASSFDPIYILQRYGEIGVEELRRVTPKDSGLTADSWYYEIEKDKGKYTIRWLNSNVVDGVNVAILIEYGHTTKSGTYVPPNQFIAPAINEVFRRLAIQIGEEVSK